MSLFKKKEKRPNISNVNSLFFCEINYDLNLFFNKTFEIKNNIVFKTSLLLKRLKFYE